MFGLNDTQKIGIQRILNELLPEELHISGYNFTKEYDLLASEIKKYEDNYSKFPKSWDEVKKLIPKN